jgi:hypothetical protein
LVQSKTGMAIRWEHRPGRSMANTAFVVRTVCLMAGAVFIIVIFV